MNEEFVSTPVGQARITWFRPDRPAAALAILGHGSATGIESPDLQGLAAALPPRGITVALITQPYRLARGRSSRATDERSLDDAWRAVWPRVASFGLPVIAGGAESVRGCDAIETMLRENVIVYDDGTPRTKHITTNLVIEVDEAAGTATSRAYFTALQALPHLPLQPIEHETTS